MTKKPPSAFLARAAGISLLVAPALGGVRNAWMPAWSGDGAQIAFVQQSGRRTYRVMTAAVTAR